MLEFRASFAVPLAVVLGIGLLSCGGGSEATATERLWVSTVPTSPKAPLTAFLTTRTGKDKYIGAFFAGSMLRGGHDVFEWIADGKDAATLRFLQDDRKRHIRFEACTPSRGFDYCLLVHGDPTGTGKYQSRKRWAVKRPGRSKGAEALSVVEVMHALVEDDEDLQTAFASEL